MGWPFRCKGSAFIGLYDNEAGKSTGRRKSTCARAFPATHGSNGAKELSVNRECHDL